MHLRAFAVHMILTGLLASDPEWQYYHFKHARRKILSHLHTIENMRDCVHSLALLQRPLEPHELELLCVVESCVKVLI